MTRSIRLYQDGDENTIAEIWLRSGRAAYTFLPFWQTFSLEEANKVVADIIIPSCRIWVGLKDDVIVAFLSMDGHIIDRLFVIPEAWRQGWGSRLIECAKKESPERLELYTHQENHAAWALYEEHGFQAVEFGMSPPPESAPDVRYVWERPILAED